MATAINNNFPVIDNYVKREEITAGTLAVSAPSLTNSGSTTFTGVVSLGNFASGGSIGTAATTVDIGTIIKIAQTTTSQTLTLPNPTVTTAGKMIIVISDSTSGFTIHGTVLTASTSTQSKAIFIWDGANWI